MVFGGGDSGRWLSYGKRNLKTISFITTSKSIIDLEKNYPRKGKPWTLKTLKMESYAVLMNQKTQHCSDVDYLWIDQLTANFA